MAVGKIKRPGALRKKLHVAKGKKIPVAKMRALKAAARRKGDTRTEREATFALNARKWKKK